MVKPIETQHLFDPKLPKPSKTTMFLALQSLATFLRPKALDFLLQDSGPSGQNAPPRRSKEHPWSDAQAFPSFRDAMVGIQWDSQWDLEPELDSMDFADFVDGNRPISADSWGQFMI